MVACERWGSMRRSGQAERTGSPTMLIKVCGITTPDDARAALDAGADWIGLNFVAGPRKIDFDHAAKIRAAIQEPQALVALVDVSPRQDETLTALLRRLKVWGVPRLQLYGQVDHAVVSRLIADGFDWLMVRPVGSATDLAQLRADLSRFAGARPSMVVVDAGRTQDRSGPLGGTGRRADWDSLEAFRQSPDGAQTPPLMLAGGLTAENVAEAARRLRPQGVDVSSGVEVRPGVKDIAAVRRFVERARAAAEAL